MAIVQAPFRVQNPFASLHPVLVRGSHLGQDKESISSVQSVSANDGLCFMSAMNLSEVVLSLNSDQFEDPNKGWLDPKSKFVPTLRESCCRCLALNCACSVPICDNNSCISKRL
jgi:hypothetical protein